MRRTALLAPPLALAGLTLVLALRAAGPAAPADGAALAASLGCGACHGGFDGGAAVRDVAPPLAYAGLRFEPAYLFSYLRDPSRVRPGIGAARMPDFHLDEREALALTRFLAAQTTPDGAAPENPGQVRRRGQSDREYRRAAAAHPGADAAMGRAIFDALNCAACHRLPGATRRRNAPDLAGIGARVRPAWLLGFLARPTAVRPFGHPPGAGGRMPDFRLSPAEADSLAALLLRGPAGAGEPDAAARASERTAAASTPETPQAAPLSAFAAAKTERLLRERWSCLGCHRLDGEGGRIGPDLSAVGERLTPARIREILKDPRRAAPGTIMPRPVLPPGSMEPLVRYLAHRTGSIGARGDTAAEPRAGYLSLAEHVPAEPVAGEDGRATYARYCGACHGAGGRGDGYNARYLPVPPTAHASAAAMADRPDDTLFDGIYAGGRILDRSHRMPAFGETLGRDRIRALVAYIRELCACDGPDWSRDPGAGAEHGGAPAPAGAARP